MKLIFYQLFFSYQLARQPGRKVAKCGSNGITLSTADKAVGDNEKLGRLGYQRLDLMIRGFLSKITPYQEEFS